MYISYRLGVSDVGVFITNPAMRASGLQPNTATFNKILDEAVVSNVDKVHTCAISENPSGGPPKVDHPKGFLTIPPSLGSDKMEPSG